MSLEVSEPLISPGSSYFKCNRGHSDRPLPPPINLKVAVFLSFPTSFLLLLPLERLLSRRIGTEATCLQAPLFVLHCQGRIRVHAVWLISDTKVFLLTLDRFVFGSSQVGRPVKAPFLGRLRYIVGYKFARGGKRLAKEGKNNRAVIDIIAKEHP